MKIHFQDGFMFFLQKDEDDEESTPTLMGAPVPAPSSKMTLNTDDFEAMDASGEVGQEAAQALSE